LLFTLDRQRIIGREGESRRVVYSVMMLVAPHLTSSITLRCRALGATLSGNLSLQR
jgi:hypothetical protein